MATGVNVYRSTDTSAPALNSTVGSLITLLDAVLVNGYGSKAAAGWTKAFSGTNAAAYRMGGGNQFYVNIDDNGPGAGVGKEARARGYETMSAIATGTGLFPTVAQSANGLFIRKSSEATGGTTARVWTIVADNRTVYMFFNAVDTGTLGYTGFMFGDFYSNLASDGYRTMIIGRSTENDATATPENLSRLATTNAVVAGHYIARSYTQLGTSITANKMSDTVTGGGIAFVGGSNMIFPNPTAGEFVACPVYVQQIVSVSAVNWRGQLRGFLCGLAGSFAGGAFANGDTLTSVTGKSYVIIGRHYQSSDGYFLMETSDTWDTN